MPRRAPFLGKLEEFENRKLRAKSENTQEHYPKILRYIWRTAMEVGISRGRTPGSWTPEELLSILEARRTRRDGRPRANSSVRNEVAILKGFLRFCGNFNLDLLLEEGDVTTPPDTRPNRRWITAEQLIHLRLAGRSDPTTITAIQLALDTLVRGGELVGLELTDLRGRYLLVRQGKGRKDREVALTERARMDLEDYIKGPRAEIVGDQGHPRLFVYRKGHQVRGYRRDSMSQKVRDLGRSLTPPVEVNLHTLRRSGGQIAYIASPTDMTVRNLQDAYGHSTVEQTREYIGAGVVDQMMTFDVRDRYLAKMYPQEFGQRQTTG